ncbi:hypothetical protein [Bacteroides neonati]|uniref:hypothetical protein n=1 Tax=Bacteroides neonati TaxID=1347393 RepID=UPI0004BA22DE|nr:hypothetical protein [Bacteroides neonati]
MEGSHSPFGMLWQIASATGWSLHHLLWKVNYPTLLLMAADAPRYVKKKKEEEGQGTRQRGSSLAFFQTKLKETQE